METELKFCIDEPGLDLLADKTTIGSFQVLDGSHSYDLDTYYDTPSHKLQAGGYACRIRLHDGQPIATLKSLGAGGGALHIRTELETHLTKPVPDLRTWPNGPAREIATELTGGEDLHPIVTLEQTRQVKPVLSNGQKIATLSLDRITAHIDGSSHTWCEVEVEMEQDTPTNIIQALSDLLHQQAQLQPEGISKFELAMQLFAAESNAMTSAPPILPEGGIKPDEVNEALNGDKTAGAGHDAPKGPGLESTDSLAQAASKLLRYYMEELEKAEKDLDDEVSEETIHQARVSVRRLRSLMRLLPEVFKSQKAQRTQRQLQRFARLLGVVRDLDVGLLNAEKFSQTLVECEKETFPPLFEIWRIERRAALSNLNKYLDSKRHRQLLRNLRTLADNDPPEPLSSPTPWQLRYLLPPLLWTQYTRIWAYDTVMTDISEDTLHELRIEAKRLRYAFEFFYELLAPEGDKLRELIIALQNHLGELQDTRVTISEIRHYLEKRAALPGSTADGILTYLQDRMDEQKNLKQGFPNLWQEVPRPRFRRTLGKALAQL
ncbi:MAG: CHAD domain-containing protein [Chloroflexi bacterium]|nr:CHAD domain-containing protein [Chloroflexota bacterium]